MTKSKIVVINTGGTFNKVYNPLSGNLEVAKDNKSLEEILSFCHNLDFEILNILSKDSLDITEDDRQELLKTIQNISCNNIIVVHGTDTMDLSADFIDKLVKDKKIIFTGSMLPISINRVEATINFAQAIGFLNANIENGIYISMHGSVKNYKNLRKNRDLGKFLNI